MSDQIVPIPSSSTSIQLAQMPQQALVRALDDDWTGVIDRVERRKLQNRLNQRAYRSRRKQPKNQTTITNQNHLSTPQPWIFTCSMAPPNVHDIMQAFENLATRSHALGAPDTDHLITLSRLNIQRAVTDNTIAIGMTMDWLKSDDALSIFNVTYPGFRETNIPTSLQPTALQRLKPHHPWLDIFPFPQMRDNMIAVEDEFDDEALCHDLMAFWDTRNTGAMLLVWGDPWDPRNWEVTEEFVAKWGWIIRGCPEILKSTDHWRSLRGEKRMKSGFLGNHI